MHATFYLQKKYETHLNSNITPILKQCKQIAHLKNSFEFDIVFKNGIRFNKDFMAIHAMYRKDFCNYLNKKKRYSRMIESPIIIGFSINKKVAKACRRNLIRRRLKAIVQKLHLQNAMKDCALVFVCRKGILEFDYNMLEQHIVYSLAKLFTALKSRKNPTVYQKNKSFKKEN